MVYVANDPMNAVDPSGEQVVVVTGAASATSKNKPAGTAGSIISVIGKDSSGRPGIVGIKGQTAYLATTGGKRTFNIGANIAFCATCSLDDYVIGDVSTSVDGSGSLAKLTRGVPITVNSSTPTEVSGPLDAAGKSSIGVGIEATPGNSLGITSSTVVSKNTVSVDHNTIVTETPRSHTLTVTWTEGVHTTGKDSERRVHFDLYKLFTGSDRVEWEDEPNN